MIADAQRSWFLTIQNGLVILLVLYFGRGLFVPLSFALLLAFILYPICVWLEAKRLSRSGAIVVALSILILLSSLLLTAVVAQVIAFAQEWPKLQGKITASFTSFSSMIDSSFGISAVRQQEMFSRFVQNSGSDVVHLITQTLSASALSLVLAILIPIYTYLMLYYRHRLVQALYYLFPQEGRANIRETLYQSIQSYYNFIKGMLIVYLVVGTLNSLGLFALGIPHAFLFGYAASIFTIIPYVGIIIASLLPISIAWVTHHSLLYPLGVVVLFVVVQYLEANIIFPWAVSNRLKINTLATLVVIIAGGILWGAAGMILFVPYLGIVKLVADRHPNLKFLSVLLGSD